LSSADIFQTRGWSSDADVRIFCCKKASEFMVCGDGQGGNFLTILCVRLMDGS